jgi:pimeloyl-ACP methyl ester carboxylesterase
MSGHKRLVLAFATGMGIASVAVTSGVVALAHRFVDELSRPHILPDARLNLSWSLPENAEEALPIYQRAVLFHTRDGKLLRGDFWAQPHPAPTIVICHGYRISRAILRPVAALEYQYGYNILLFDFRGHGGSESVYTSGGNVEVRDLEAAIAVASQQPETIPGKVILHGFSMGAAVALMTLPHPDVAGIIADSPYAHLDVILRSLIHWQLSEESSSWPAPLRPLRRAFMPLSWATVAASTVVFRLRFRQPLMAHPASHLKGWQRKVNSDSGAALPPILLIHASNDAFIPISHAYQIAAQAQAHHIPLETYYTEGSMHCNSYGDYPQQYIDRLQRFAERCLGDDFPRMRTTQPA